MPNLKIFGHQIHDTALVFIGSSILSSLIFDGLGELGRNEANYILLISAFVSTLYWIKEYKK